MQPQGNAEMLAVEQARQAILTALAPLGSERVPLARACGRWLAAPVRAREDGPAEVRSQMDGYAVRHAEVSAATASRPVELAVAFAVAAGAPPPAPLPPGAAARVLTGAPLPPGADAVVPQEWTLPLEPAPAAAGGPACPQRIRILQPPPGPGAFVRPRAEDFAAGETVLQPGIRLGPGEVALAAAAGAVELEVGRRPRVALLATGSELLPPGAAWRPGAVRESNRFLLEGMLARAGAEVEDFGIVPDEPAAVRAGLVAALAAADLVLSTGGVSVGSTDFVKAEAEALGLVRRFWRVRVRPGKPLYFAVPPGGPSGAGRRAALLGLPGNPASVLVSLVLFALPAVAWLQGAREPAPRRTSAVLAAPAHAPAGRRTYLRARAWLDGAGRLCAQPLARQASGSVRAVAETNALLEIGEQGGQYQAGASLPALLLEQGGLLLGPER
ncbi:MAG: molybdopterin molybdenumtransferase MoeA [Planctomycetota bacterium]|nr:MAG: molybdopterin molybdenumtransferase MoeA [Planctomycetota bacterium]